MPLDTVQHDHPDTVVAARWAEHLTGDETGEVFDVPKVGFDLKVRQCPMDIRVKAQCRQGVLQPDENSPHCPGSGVPVARSSGIVRDSLVQGLGTVGSIAWRPGRGMDPERLASVGNDGILRLWDMEAGMEVLTPSGNKTNLVSVSWSPDGQQLVAGAPTGRSRYGLP